ncbi:MAG: hypothetical protein OXH11_11985 [Candidatus Aminicenantes bacterium]|nr:hypothetical protein [Candidatus Aminicenantes bacterium]
MTRLETELQRRSQAHRAANRSTRENWRSFTRHRNRVMELLGDESRRQGKVAILGAGNCNDLDLVQLASECGEIHLFDLDREAMEGALLRQGVPERPNIHLRDDLDLSGLSDSEHATGPDPAADFDLVVSTCVVSQLLETVSRVLPPGLHRDRIMLQVRDAHVRLMTGLTAPGGTGIVVTDVAEADSNPGSSAPPEPASARETVRKGRHFLGLDTKGIRQALGAVRNLKESEPWTWQLDPVRRYLVQAVRFTKSAGG